MTYSLQGIGSCSSSFARQDLNSSGLANCRFLEQIYYKMMPLRSFFRPNLFIPMTEFYGQMCCLLASLALRTLLDRSPAILLGVEFAVASSLDCAWRLTLPDEEEHVDGERFRLKIRSQKEHQAMNVCVG